MVWECNGELKREIEIKLIRKEIEIRFNVAKNHLKSLHFKNYDKFRRIDD